MKSRIQIKVGTDTIFAFWKKVSVPIFLLVSLTLVLGCGKPTPTVTDITAAHQKFLKVCSEDAHLKPLIKPLENTLYIYLPIEHEIMSTKANGKAPFQSPMSKSSPAILFLDGEHQEKRLSFTYDITQQKSYANELGYKYAYNEEYLKKDSALFQALLRAYGDLDQEHLPGDVEFEGDKKNLPPKEVGHYKPKKLSPDFIVLIIADIKNGIEIIKTFHFSDYRHTSFGNIPPEEFMKRQIVDVVGRATAIGDKSGEHITYQDLTWPEFLTRQIVQRIKFKYQQSAFPPNEDNEEEILKIVHETVQAYTFEDFQSVQLKDLANDKTYLFDKAQLKTFQK